MAALQGADLLCVPTNLVPMREQPQSLPVMASILAMGGACELHARPAADRVGTERGQAFLGRSVIVGHTGWPFAGPASADRTEMMLTGVNLSDARRDHNLNAFNQILRDRRTDLYAQMLSASAPRGWH